MACYLIAVVSISDHGRFQEYLKGIHGLSERFGGRTVARGPVSEVLEGEAQPGERIVVTEYPDIDAARSYIQSAEYQAAKDQRVGAATVTMRLIEG